MADVHELVLKSDSTQIRKSGKDLDSLSTSAKKTEHQTDRLAKTTRKSIANFSLYNTQTLVLTATLGYLTTKSLQYADSMTNVDSKLRLVTDSTEELVKVQEDLFEISQRTRTGFTDNIDLYQKMTMSTKELNLSMADRLALTETINKSMAVSGTTAEGTATLVTQLGQAFSSNFQAVAQELGTIRDQAPALYQTLLKGTGLSTAAFKKAAEEGKLSSKIIVDALKSQADAVDEDFTKISVTIGKSMVNAENSVTRMIGNIDKATGLSKSLSSTILDASSAIDANSESITNAALTTFNYIGAGVAGVNVIYETVENTAQNIVNGVNIIVYGALTSITQLLLTTTTALNSISLASDETLQENKDLVAFVEGAYDKALLNSATNWLEIGDAMDSYNSAIDKVIGKTKEAKEELVDLSAINTGAGGSTSSLFIPDKAEAQKALNDLNALSFKLMNDRKDAQKDALNDLNALSLQLMEDEATEQKRINDALATHMAGTMADAIQAGLEGRDLLDFASRLGMSMGNAMAQQAISQMIQAQAFTGAGLAGLGIGVGVMAISSLLGQQSDDRESQAERAEKEFNIFISGLNKASLALESFGNVGSSIELQITSVQDELARQRELLASSQSELGIQQAIVSGDTGSIEETMASIQIGLLERQISAATGLISSYTTELNDIVTENLASTLDISKLTVSQLESLTSSIDTQSAIDMATELNNLALQAKVSGSALEDNSRAIEILTDTNFIAYQNNTEALELLNKAEEERTEKLKEQVEQLEKASTAWSNSFKSVTRVLMEELNPDVAWSFLTDSDLMGFIPETLADLQLFGEAFLDNAGGIADGIEDLTSAESAFLTMARQSIEAREQEAVSLQTQLDLLTGATTQRELELASIDETNRSIQEAIFAEEDRQKLEADNQKLLDDRIKSLNDEKTATEKMIEAQQDNIKKITSLVQSEMLGTLSFLDDAGKLAYANNILATSASPEDRISSARSIAEISQGTTRTREDYAPIFAEYLSEVQKQADEATTQDLVDKLDEIKEAIEESAESATEDSIYGT